MIIDKLESKQNMYNQIIETSLLNYPHQYLGTEELLAISVDYDSLSGFQNRYMGELAQRFSQERYGNTQTQLDMQTTDYYTWFSSLQIPYGTNTYCYLFPWKTDTVPKLKKEQSITPIRPDPPRDLQFTYIHSDRAISIHSTDRPQQEIVREMTNAIMEEFSLFRRNQGRE